MYRELSEVHVCAFCWGGGTKEGPFRKQSESKRLLEGDTSGTCTKMGINPSRHAWLKKGFENSTRVKDCLVNLVSYVLTFHGRWAYTSKPSPDFGFYMSMLNASWLERRAGGGDLKLPMTW